jgi:hypothetical protein
MTIQLVKKLPTGKSQIDRFRIEIPGHHTLKKKISMGMLSKYHLEHEEGIYGAGITHIYMELLDPDWHPITHFRDGRLISDYTMIIKHDYPCAADEYRA